MANTQQHPNWIQVTVYDEASGERVATVFRSDAIPLFVASPDLLAWKGRNRPRTGERRKRCHFVTVS